MHSKYEKESKKRIELGELDNQILALETPPDISNLKKLEKTPHEKVYLNDLVSHKLQNYLEKLSGST